MKPSTLRNHIKDLKSHLACLEKYLETQTRRHQKLDCGNGTYDPVHYHVAQLFIHAGMLNADCDRRKSKDGADGKGKQFLKLLDGSMMKCYVADGEHDKEW